MGLHIVYHFDEGAVAHAETASSHERLREVLGQLKGRPGVEITLTSHREAFPNESTKTQLFETLRDFSARHHISLRRVFGSNSSGFWFLPAQFLLVYEERELREVFPCEVERDRIEPQQFLERLTCGEAWTVLGQSRPNGKGKHQALVEAICQRPELLGLGLRLCRSDVHVSRRFGEAGYIDIVLQDKEGHYLLLEVKVKPDEIDKAIGQILRHREFFCSQNFLEPDRVRLGIACSYFPEHARSVCARVGIEIFDLGSAVSLRDADTSCA